MSHYLSQGLHRALQQHPQRVATVYAGRRQSFATLADRVARLAAGLRALGVAERDRVAMLALNSDRYLEFYLACFWIGAIATPLNARWSAAEVETALQDAEAAVLLLGENFGLGAAELRRTCPALRGVIHVGDGVVPEAQFGYEDLLAAHAPIADQRHGGDAPAFLIYTGGTTGAPKGVVLSHANLFAASLGMLAAGCGTHETCLHVAPMFHMACLQIMTGHYLLGGTHVIAASFQPLGTLQLIEQERVTDVTLVPTMLQMLIEHPQRADCDLSSLRRVLYGAAPITEALLERALAALPAADFVQGYGMTETGLTLMLPAHYHTAAGRRLGKLGTAGRALPAAEVRIVDTDDREQPRGIPGEIVSRGPMLMQGYWRQPALSAETLRGGWMHTGDIGVMDEDGFVTVVDRLKDMIVSGGENVYSSEVENALMRHAAVAQCAVIGVPDERWGERVHAVIVRRPGTAMIDDEELIAHCRSLIAAYKCPRSFEFRDALPLSAAGKLLKHVLREPHWRDQARQIN